MSDVFRVDHLRAKTIAHEVVNTVRTWRDRAERLSISRHEQDLMRRAFRIAEHYSG